MDLQLAGRVAFITGAGGGIGRETALLLAAEGVAVAAADLDVAKARAIADAVRGLQGTTDGAANARAAALAIDVGSEASVAEAVAEATRTLGPIDILVNCAGIYTVGQLSEVDPAAWDKVLDVNLRGTYLTCRAVLPGMIEQGRGSIVNLASISGRTKSILATPSYVASKAGIIGLTMSLASQNAAKGVRVNAVAPGPVDTDMIRGLPGDMQSHLITTIPIGRLATAREIASAIAFLASDVCASATGETLNVNGGAFMV